MLAAASALLYLAGMVLNDVFDAETDAEERPHRPIPSQRVNLRTAKILGWSLLALGVLTAAHLGYHGNSTRTTLVALGLAGCVVLYDAGAKRTPLGPLVMGSCRMLNVLLGMSLATAADGMTVRPWSTAELLLAAGLGVYIAGVSILARGEAGVSLRKSLAAGIAVLVAGIGLIASAPTIGVEADDALTGPKLGTAPWLILWCLLGAVIVRRCFFAWRNPQPGLVQQAVRTCLRSIIVIDAAVVLGYGGPFWGGAVLALLVPMLLLERWASTT
jgi:4-hydroxybenzoate polyprenyltransferase